MVENFKQRLKQADLVSKNDFDNKLISFDKKTIANKTKYQKKLNSLTTKDYNFSLSRMYFTSDDGFQNMFVYQSTLDTLALLLNETHLDTVRGLSN